MLFNQTIIISFQTISHQIHHFFPIFFVFPMKKKVFVVRSYKRMVTQEETQDKMITIIRLFLYFALQAYNIIIMKMGQWKNSTAKALNCRSQQKISKQSLKTIENIIQDRKFKMALVYDKFSMKEIVEMPCENLMDVLDIYQWREQTDYPIVACRWKQLLLCESSFIIRNKNQLITVFEEREVFGKAMVQVESQSVWPLELYGPLPFANFLYALKQTLVGFQRLFALFGSFQIDPRMIAVNSEGRVKVWISSNFAYNTKKQVDRSKLFTSEEEYIIRSIKDIFMKNASQTITFKQFVKNLAGVRNFLSFFRYIEQFCLIKKIIIAKRIIKKDTMNIKRPLSPVIKLKNIPKIPKFVDFRGYRKSYKQYKSSKQIPTLDLVINKSQFSHNSNKFQGLKTKQTANGQKSSDLIQIRVSCFDTRISRQNAGKIVKNQRSGFISTVKSLDNLTVPVRFQNEEHKKQEMKNIEKQMNKLFEEDEPQSHFQKRKSLIQYGRPVSQSIIVLK